MLSLSSHQFWGIFIFQYGQLKYQRKVSSKACTNDNKYAWQSLSCPDIICHFLLVAIKLQSSDKQVNQLNQLFRIMILYQRGQLIPCDDFALLTDKSSRFFNSGFRLPLSFLIDSASCISGTSYKNDFIDSSSYQIILNLSLFWKILLLIFMDLPRQPSQL